MNYRYMELLGLRDISSDLTVTIDLNMADPISEILLDTRVTNGAGGGETSTAHPIASVTKIEIVDGSDVLFSLDGYEAEALDIYHSGKYPRGGWFNYIPSSPTDRQIALSFGRHLWDPELALDPKKFTNPQLKITFDISAGGMAPSKCELSVLAALFDQKAITPVGFLMTKELKRWTSDAPNHEYTDMPTDYPYRKLFLQGRLDSNPPYWVFGNIKLSEDQDKKVVVNGEFRDLMFGIGRENAHIHETINTSGSSGLRGQHCTPTSNVNANANSWSEESSPNSISVYNGDGGYLTTIGELGINQVICLEGWAPHGTLQIPFGLQDVPDDWYDVTKIGSLRLDVTDGVDDCTSKVFIQQFRKYA